MSLAAVQAAVLSVKIDAAILFAIYDMIGDKVVSLVLWQCLAWQWCKLRAYTPHYA